MAGSNTRGFTVPTPATPCAGERRRTRVRVWGLRVARAPFGGGTAGRTALIISEGRAFNWHDTR